MKLELRYPASPENALDHAQLAVEAAWESGFELDYSPGSLETADAQIEALREEGRTGEEAAEALFVLGCYLGEVMVRALGGRTPEREAMARPPGATPAQPRRAPSEQVLTLRTLARPPTGGWRDGSAWDPIGKAYKRLELGDSEYLPGYFAAAARSRR